MTTAMNKSSFDETVQAVLDGYLYPDETMPGAINWKLTQGIFPEMITRIVSEYQFVSNVMKSDGQAFGAEKTLAGTKIKKVSPLVHQLYDLYRFPKAIPPKKYQLNHYSIVLAEIAKSLNVEQARLTGDPMAVIGSDGLREWEFINTIFSRIKMASNRPSFKERCLAVKKSTAGEYQRLSRCVKRLCDIHPDLMAYRVEIGYQAHSSGAISLHEAVQHFEAFLHALKTDPSLGLPVGHWWAREYIAEIGFRHHLVLFISPKVRFIDDGTFFRQYSRWNDIAHGSGFFYRHNFNSGGSRSCGTGGLMDFMGSGKKTLMRSLKLMIEREHYLKLEPSADFDHYGMGEMPRLAKPTEQSTYGVLPAQPGHAQYIRLMPTNGSYPWGM